MSSWVVKYSGITRSIQQDSLSVSLRLGQRGTCSFTYFDEVGDDLPDEYAEVTITNPNGLLVFGGTLTRRKLSLLNELHQSTGDARVVACECRDHNDLAYRRIVSAQYTDMTTGDIARALVDHINAWGEEGLGKATITAGSGILLAGTVIFDGVYFSEALDFLAQQQGGYWNIDAGKSLHLAARSDTAAPFSLSVGSHPYLAMEAERTLDRYRNAQYVIGSPTGQGLPQTEVVTNDVAGGLEAVGTVYPIYSVTSLEFNGSALTVGRAGNPDDVGSDAFFTPGERNLTLATPSPTTAADYVVVYSAARRVLGYAERDEDARLKRHEKIHVDESLSTDKQCQQVADNLVASFPVVDLVTYQTREHGMLPGQVQSIVLPAYLLDGSFLVESVSFGKLKDAANEKAQYRITASSALSQSSDTLSDLARRDENLSTGEGEKLDRIVPRNDNIGIGAAVVVAEI